MFHFRLENSINSNLILQNFQFLDIINKWLRSKAKIRFSSLFCRKNSPRNAHSYHNETLHFVFSPSLHSQIPLFHSSTFPTKNLPRLTVNTKWTFSRLKALPFIFLLTNFFHGYDWIKTDNRKVEKAIQIELECSATNQKLSTQLLN